MRPWRARAAVLLASITGCSSVGASSDEPLGVVLEASGNVPALEMALTVNPAREAPPLLEPLTAALHGALSACAAHGYGALQAGLSLAFELQRGRARAQREQAGPLARCVASALAGKPLSVAPAVQSFTLRLRTAHAERSRVRAR